MLGVAVQKLGFTFPWKRIHIIGYKKLWSIPGSGRLYNDANYSFMSFENLQSRKCIHLKMIIADV